MSRIDSYCDRCGGCGPAMNRRNFLAATGGAALATGLGPLDFASSLFAATAPAPAGKAVVHVVFVRPLKTPLISWPGGQTDVGAMQALFAKMITDAAEKTGIQLDLKSAPLENKDQINAYLEAIKGAPPDGLLVCAMELTQWPEVLHLVENRGAVPTVVYSHLTAFTGNMQKTRQVPNTFVGATPDVDWLAFALRMLNTVWRMKNTRLAVITRAHTREDESKDVVADAFGTTLHMIPAARFDEELAKVDAGEEVKAMADRYAADAQEIVEPTKADIIDAARNYIVCRRILEAENCQGLSYDCLGRPNPVCIAFSRLLDEGIVAGCEADVDAALSMLLTQSLFDRSGFIQDPSPNTVSNTLIGAHCTSPTKLEGLASAYRAPYKIRSYHTRTGACMEVLWPVDREVTVMKFIKPDTIVLGSGRVVSNIMQPPSGCCRTAVEITVDGVEDMDQAKGFHQLFILGNLERGFRAYCQLAGIKAVHI
ncbi:MAG: hypothetical protein NTZ09_12305 [Candidatus Hydrogenedentes bacterium]|nr:hypothetical protein [Candidatus Hydrogenedentota bacterium]